MLALEKWDIWMYCEEDAFSQDRSVLVVREGLGKGV